MKLAILSTALYPSKFANRVHILNMAKSFARKGLDVHFFTREILLDYTPDYKIRNFSHFKRSFSLAYVFVKALKCEKYDLIFIREPRLLFWYIVLSHVLNYKNTNVIYEVHDMPRDLLDYILVKIMNRYVRSVVVITDSLKNDLSLLNKKLADKTIVLPDGVDPELFDTELSKQKAREIISQPIDKKIAVYTGSLFRWKGIDTLRAVAEKMPNVLFLFVGGKTEEVKNFKQECKDISNVIVLGYVEQKLIPHYMKAADILVLPNTAKIPISNKYTSPLKLFEYMMSKRPIVASATPAIREILVDSVNAYLCTPDSVESLEKKIEYALSDPKADQIAQSAYNRVWQYTWDTRVENLLNFIYGRS